MLLEDPLTFTLLTYIIYKLLYGYFSTELENQAKVQKSLVRKEFVLQNRFPPPTSKMQNFLTSLSEYLKLISTEVPKLYPT